MHDKEGEEAPARLRSGTNERPLGSCSLEVFGIVRRFRLPDEFEHTFFRNDNVAVHEGAIFKNTSQQILVRWRDHAFALTPHLLDARLRGFDTRPPLLAGHRGGVIQIVALLGGSVACQTAKRKENDLTEIHRGDPNGAAIEGGQKSGSKKLSFQSLRLASLGIDKNLERSVP